jgi:hypothetical protein
MATQLIREMCCPTANYVNMRVFTIATLTVSVPDWRRLGERSLSYGRLRIMRTFSGKIGPRGGVVSIPRAFHLELMYVMFSFLFDASWP